MDRALLTPEALYLEMEAQKDFYALRNLNIADWRNMYFRVKESVFLDQEGNYEEPEDDEIRVILPKFENIVAKMMELLFTKTPTISVPKSKLDAHHNVQVDDIEKILYAIWHHTNMREQALDSLWHGLVDGWGVLQVVYDVNAEKDECPIVIIPQDPMNVYAQPGNRPGEWKKVIHTYPKLVGALRDEWLIGLDKRTRAAKEREAAFTDWEDDKLVTFVERWDATYHAVMLHCETKDETTGETIIENRWLKSPIKHGYGFLPWEIYFPCRLPFRTAGSMFGVSICHVILDLIRYQCRLVSQKATALDRWLDPPLVTRTEAGKDFQAVRAEAGLQLKLDLEEDAFYLINPGPPAAMSEQMALIQEEMEQGSIPKVLYGQYVGAASGIAMSLLRNPTLMTVAFKQKAIERALSSLNVKILKLVEKFIRTPIYMWGSNNRGEGLDVMIDREVISGYYRNEVKLSASLPSDDAGMVNMLGTLVQLKVISTDTARDVAQQTLHDLLPQSLTDEAKKVIAEQILQNPMLLQGLAMQAAQEAGIPFPLEQPGGGGPGGGLQPGGGQPGLGEAAERMPAGTLPSQTPGLPGGNTAPSMTGRMAEMRQQTRGA